MAKLLANNFLCLPYKIQPLTYFFSPPLIYIDISCHVCLRGPYLQLMTVSVTRRCVTFCEASYLGITAAGNNSRINTQWCTQWAVQHHNSTAAVIFLELQPNPRWRSRDRLEVSLYQDRPRRRKDRRRIGRSVVFTFLFLCGVCRFMALYVWYEDNNAYKCNCNLLKRNGLKLFRFINNKKKLS